MGVYLPNLVTLVRNKGLVIQTHTLKESMYLGKILNKES
jgi:hypothetical protein